MTPAVVIGLLIGLPIVFILLMRANAAIVFLALCAGSVLAQFVSDETFNIFSSFIPADGSTNLSIVQLSLMYLPVFFTALFTRKSISGAKTLTNLVPAIATGLVGALLAVPLLPGGVKYNVTSSEIWPVLEQYQGLIVAVAVLISLFSLWSTKPKHGKGKHKK